MGRFGRSHRKYIILTATLAVLMAAIVTLAVVSRPLTSPPGPIIIESLRLIDRLGPHPLRQVLPYMHWRVNFGWGHVQTVFHELTDIRCVVPDGSRSKSRDL